MGVPNAPRLRVNAVDLRSCTLEWKLETAYAKPEFLNGYKLIIDNSHRETFEKNVQEFLFADMQPGKKYDIELISLANSIVGDSKPSNKITLVCPKTPNAPVISALSTTRPNSAVIGWQQVEPKSENSYDQIISYK